jgi:two-component system CheB/CheR fusion protein
MSMATARSDAATPADPQLVVIGASAGGVNALQELVAALPADFPAPIVIAQHQAAGRPSRLAELLSARARLTVRVAGDHQPLESGVIYVVPADPNVEITDHHIGVRREDDGPYTPSIDRVMATAAAAFGEKLICIVLTGTGTDGAAGALAVKAYGGTVIVQNPKTAAFSGMPSSVPSAAVDIVADLDDIGPLLVDLVAGRYGSSGHRDIDELPAFLDHVRELSGLDFSAYKRPTIERRLQRRMAAVGAANLTEYSRYLNRTPEEQQRLVASFLIKVTRFFRDPEIYTYLRDHILPPLIEEARTRGELRLWSAGCATGEEAYTLAMMVADLLGEERGSMPVRIFATDVAADAIDFARHGVYPAASLAGVPPDLVERYFTPRDGTYEVTKLIRGMVIFGEHNLVHRAPFPRIDLILCRNVLIYFTPELQRRSLQVFAFSLRSGGYLALGKAESVSPLPEFFALENTRLKIFRRIGGAAPIPADHILDTTGLGIATRPPRRPPPRLSGSISRVPATPTVAQEVVGMLDQVTVGIVAVDRHYDVRFINLVARRLLGIRDSALGDDLVHSVVPAIAAPLKGALDAAFRGETTAVICQLPPDAVDDSRELSLTCIPTRDDDGEVPVEGAIAEVIDITDASRQRSDVAQERDRLQRERDDLHRRAALAVNEVRELRSVNETMAAEQSRLRTDNEHLQLAHEESQATAEEIETLNEEQQATVEELETLNEELQATVEEVNASNSELEARAIELESMTSRLDLQRRDSEADRDRLEAILTNMSDAVLVVDDEGGTILINAAWEAMFGTGAEIEAQDANGRLLPASEQPGARATGDEPFTMTFTLPGAGNSRRWFEASGRPVQGASGARWGVIVVRDISERSLRHLQEQFLATATHELRTPLTVLSGRLQLLARQLRRADVDDKTRTLADQALDQQRRVEARVSELMDMSRLQRGPMIVERQPVDLRAVVRETAEVMEPVTNGMPITVDVPAEPVVIAGDVDRLNQVLINLLNNALKYARESDRIDLRVTRDADHATIEVEDHGPGIPAEALPNIFRRFYQGHAMRSSADGLGIGLFIVHEIVEAHGGTISPRSTVGEGTTFVIELPLLPDGETAPGAETGSQIDRSTP